MAITAYDANVTWAWDWADDTGMNVRRRIGSAELTGSGSRIRVKLPWSSTHGDYAITSAYIGYPISGEAGAGADQKFVSTPARLTYADQQEFTITSGERWTDPVEFPFDGSKDILLSMYVGDQGIPVSLNPGQPQKSKSYLVIGDPADYTAPVNYSDSVGSDYSGEAWLDTDVIFPEKIEILAISGSGEIFKNSIRLGSTQTFDNSLGQKITSSGEQFLNSLTAPTTGTYWFKNSIKATVTVTNTETFQNRLLDDTMGYSSGEFTFDATWGL